jgi:hypothetical protein
MATRLKGITQEGEGTSVDAGQHWPSKWYVK